jgi:hypothetical protein
MGLGQLRNAFSNSSQIVNASLPRRRARIEESGSDVKQLIPFLLLGTLIPTEPTAAQCTGGGFQAPVRYASSATITVVLRDLDGDGFPEILTSGNQVVQSSAFSLFANRRDGTFAPERLITTGFGERMEDVGDLDGDGRPDLLASDYWANGIVVHRSTGALQFDAGTPYGTATHGGPSLIADSDGDGLPDVLTLSFGSGNPVRLHLFHGKGDGTLAPKTTYDTHLAIGNAPTTRTMGGALEILVGERSGHLAILRYKGGTLTVSVLPAGPGFDTSNRFADLDGDGVADIVDTDDSESGTEEPIFVTMGNADGTFRERKRPAHPRKVSLPSAVRVADLDGDGRPDLVVSDFQTTSLYAYRGDGTGGFAEGVAIDAGGPVNAFEVADVNADGRPDLVTVNSDHTISVILNRAPCPPLRRRAVGH